MSRKPITSKNYANEAMTLVDEDTFAPICTGDLRITSRNQTYHVTGGRAPHKESSSGKVWCVLTPYDNFSESMRFAREEAGGKPYSEGELATCWGDMSNEERREWVVPGSMEFYPAVIKAKWMHDATLAAYRKVDALNKGGATPGASHVLLDEFEHAEAPSTISAVNRARGKARAVVMKSKSKKGAK